MLVQCGHDVAEAIRRISLNVVPLEKSLSVWSEEETLKFEKGLVNNGKNFHAIQKEVFKYNTFIIFYLILFLTYEVELHVYKIFNKCVLSL